MKYKRSVGTLIGMAAVAAFFTTLWNTSDFGRAARSLETQRAAARREGVPMDWQELYRLAPSYPVDENAAVPYARGFAALHAAGNLKGVKTDQLAEQIANGKATSKDLERLREALVLVKPALEQIHEGSIRKGYSFDRRWEQGASLLFPQFADARSAERALVLRAMIATDPVAAGDDLRTAARLRAHTGSEPILISPLVGFSMETEIHRAIRFVGRRRGAWAKAVEPALDDLGPIPDLRRFLAGESVMEIHINEELVKQGPQAFGYSSSEGSPGLPPALRLARFGPVRDAFEARIIEHWREIYASLPKDPLDWQATKKSLASPRDGRGMSYALLDIVGPVYEGVSAQPAQLETERRLTRAALDLWQGKSPYLSLDPFGKGPLQMRRKGKDWTLWSFGPDGIDDGGKARKKASETRYDLVVTSRPKD